MPQTLTDVINDATNGYVAGLGSGPVPSVRDIRDGMYRASCQAIELANAVLPKGQKFRVPSNLTPYQIATVIDLTMSVCLINCTKDVTFDTSNLLLGIYQPEGPDAGLYITSELGIKRIIASVAPGILQKDANEVVFNLQLKAETRQRCSDPDLVAVNNGIFDYKTKTLLPFSPEYVFLNKSRTDYRTSPSNPVIRTPDGDDWDVESWMASLSDDPEIVDLLWQITGATLRPFVRWNKSAWFYSTVGNNGKGTLCTLMRNLCGPGTFASIPIADFGKDFRLEPLIHATSIIVDENDVGDYIDKAANLKAVITGDAIQVNRKFKMPIAFEFHGFMVQCVNDMPRIRDKSDSFYRRQLFVPFDKCFTGQERTYIKSDYLSRPDVLEYVLWRVLNMDYDRLSEPEACLAVLAEYKNQNDPIRQFADEVIPLCQWGLLPYRFLYDLYKAWYPTCFPSGKPQGKSSFITDLQALARSDGVPGYVDSGGKVRVKNLMDAFEPLILDYDLTAWMKPGYTGNDRKTKATPQLSPNYVGLLRT